MKNKEDNLNKLETVSTIIVNVGTIVSWLITLLTAFVLTTQTQPVSIPGIIVLGAPYKLMFILTIFLSYIQLLRRIWANAKRSLVEAERTFGGYVFNSVIRFRRPIVVVGFFIIFGIFTVVIFDASVIFASILYFFGGAALLGFLGSDDAKTSFEKMKQKYDDEFQNRWLKRIKKRLYEHGIVYTGDFQNMSIGIEEINWAIKFYFNYYEFEQDLVFGQEYYEKDINYYELYEIRFRHVPSKLEMILDSNKDKNA